MVNETPSEVETHSNGDSCVFWPSRSPQFLHGQTGQSGFWISGHFERFVVWFCASPLWRTVKLAYSFEHSAWWVRLVWLNDHLHTFSSPPTTHMQETKPQKLHSTIYKYSKHIKHAHKTKSISLILRERERG
jgi:hypothetical protein